MALKTKTREITLTEERGTFSLLFKKLYGESEDYNLEGLSALRHLLSNQKAKLLHAIKTKSPASVYALAKLTGRDFKAVMKDLKALERFGFITFTAEKSGKRPRLKPQLALDTLNITFKI